MDNKLPKDSCVLGEKTVNIAEHKTKAHNVSKNFYNIYQSNVMNIAEDNNELKEFTY